MSGRVRSWPTDSPVFSPPILWFYCLTKCLYKKCRNLIGWIVECRQSARFRIDSPERFTAFDYS